MKTLVLLLIMTPLYLFAQTDTRFRTQTPVGSLKPIDIREFPYTYTTHSYRTYNGHGYSTSSTHTDLKRIYSYDGIDVDKPAETLTPTIMAVHDPDADQELSALQENLRKQHTATTIGCAMLVPGFIMMIAGGIQAADYKKALDQAIKTYTSATTSVFVNCSTFGGTTDPRTGITTYTCLTDHRIVTTNPGAGSFLVPGSSATAGPPTTVDLPNGTAIGLTGIGLMLTGIIVAATGSDHIDHFHRAVQYYNRALSRKISWTLTPYSTYGQSGLVLRGRF